MQPDKATISKRVPIQRWVMVALAVAVSLATGQAQAAAPQPDIPVIGCTTDPNIFNTGIAGKVSDNSTFNLSTPKSPASTGTANMFYDLHWQKGFIPGASPAAANWPSKDPVGGVYNPYDTVDVNGNKIPYSYLNSISWDAGTASVYSYGSPWVASPFSNAEWLGFHNSIGNYTSGDTNNNMFYRYQFDLDPAVDASRFNLVLDFMADDYLKQIFVNGKPVLTNVDNGNYASFDLARRRSIPLIGTWNPGSRNTIIVQTSNLTAPSGFLVQSRGTPVCTSKVAVQKVVSGNVTSNSTDYTVPFQVSVSNSSTSSQTFTLRKLCKTNESRRCSSPTAVHAVLTQIFC